MRRFLGAIALGAVLVAGSLVATPKAAQAAPLPPECSASGDCELEFAFSGDVARWTVPDRAVQVSFRVIGASGQSHWYAAGLGGGFSTKPADIAAGTEFAMAVGQGGQGAGGGWGGGGAGGALGDGASYQGQGGGGGTYVFSHFADAPWRLFAIAGGGAGAAGGTADWPPAGGGANEPGEGGGFGGSDPGNSAGSPGAGPASYSPGGGFAPGQGGGGGAARFAGNGSGSGGGGGLMGGAGGVGGVFDGPFDNGTGTSPLNTGLAGGGGSGFLAQGFAASSIEQQPLAPGESRNGSVVVSYKIGPAKSEVAAAGPVVTDFGSGPVDLAAQVTCVEPLTGGTVTFAQGATVLGTATVDSATGRAVLAYTPARQGSYTTTAKFSGSDACTPASTSFDLFVSVATGKFSSVSAAPASLTLGESTTLRATAVCPAQPAGSIEFSRDGESLATVPVDADGTAEYRYTPKRAGVDVVQVFFSSDQGSCVVTAENLRLAVSPKPTTGATPTPTATPTAGGSLASTGTGSDPAPMLGAAFLMLGVGGGMLLLVRRAARRGRTG
ncbi:Ig-like domain-containing protein [Leucobacter iarius]|uniref:Bacterial Ig-like domain-containing protein n=1 Tax=Leucobacter iarius TaxID=333963 RepID=A0ABN2LD50_9MICO